MFGVAFEGLKSAFNTQKVRLKKKNIHLVKKKKNALSRILKAKKITKTHFCQKFKNNVFAQKFFFT
jgi:hypothetical protein